MTGAGRGALAACGAGRVCGARGGSFLRASGPVSNAAPDGGVSPRGDVCAGWPAWCRGPGEAVVRCAAAGRSRAGGGGRSVPDHPPLARAAVAACDAGRTSPSPVPDGGGSDPNRSSPARLPVVAAIRSFRTYRSGYSGFRAGAGRSRASDNQECAGLRTGRTPTDPGGRLGRAPGRALKSHPVDPSPRLRQIAPVGYVALETSSPARYCQSGVFGET